MYYVFLDSHNYYYEIYEIINLFFPYEKISLNQSLEDISEDDILIKNSVWVKGETVCSESSISRVKDQEITEMFHVKECCPLDENLKKSLKRCVKLSTYKLMRDVTGREMPWGILVGIRPSKIVNDLKSRKVDNHDIKAILKERYLIRDDKINLVMEVSENSRRFINRDKKNVSVYIGIPFCPTRCVYCSFASYPISGYEKYVKGYVEALKYEIGVISSYLNKRFKIDTLYIGGGTPTSLDDNTFNMLLEHIGGNFNIDSLNEFTVEAGRPDTINSSKLSSMKNFGVNRISINPQSMNEETLKRIGRNHSVQDVIEKYIMSREYGFRTINMDMILGLPGEDMENVRVTLERILSLKPENITVHTMSVKRASRLREKIMDKVYAPVEDDMDINAVMEIANKRIQDSEYIPYYMYRQKMTLGNLENVGYAIKGHECLYNIEMIEEKETIVGLGADSVSKLVFHDENRIERFANKKDLKEYIDTIEERVEKKLEFLEMLT